MSHLIVEIKARCPDPDRVRAELRARGAEFRGLDHQVDTYFRCTTGRLKLREGDIEHSLIHYQRPNQAGPKDSEVTMVEPPRGLDLKAVLTAALGVRVVIDKRREIWYLDNVKIHVDEVAGLGSFVEIEAIDRQGTRDRARLLEQCRELMAAFVVAEGDLVAESYSDLLIRPH